MMTREERAKQFMPFDALQGLRKALKEREERHFRVQKHDISEEEQNELNLALAHLKRGMSVTIDCHDNYHDVTKVGRIEGINTISKFLILNDEKICFADIYKIVIN